MENIKFIKRVWEDVYNLKLDTKQTIEKYFHPNFEQCINGVVIKRPEYITHVTAQKENFILNSIDYQESLEKKDEIFTAYYIKGKNKENIPIEAEVIIYAKLLASQILKVHGLVILTQGNEKEVDI